MPRSGNRPARNLHVPTNFVKIREKPLSTLGKSGKAKTGLGYPKPVCVKTKNCLVQNGVVRTNNLLVALGSRANLVDGIARTSRRVASHQWTMNVVEGASLAAAKIGHHLGIRRSIRRLLAVFQGP